MGIRFFQLLLFSLVGFSAAGQQYAIKNYTTFDGLINNRAQCVSQDADGFIWIGTDDGVCRFDGRSFKYFAFPGAKGFAFVPCAKQYKGSVLFSTCYGVMLCRAGTANYTAFKNGKKRRVVDALALSDTSFIVADYTEGLLLLDKNGEKNIAIPGSNYALMLNRDFHGNIRLGSAAGLVFFPGGNFSRPTIQPFFNGMYINAIKPDHRGNLFIVTDHGVFKINYTDLTNVNVTPRLLYPTSINNLTSLTFDSTGRPWLATYQGVVRFDDNFENPQIITQANGLSENTIWDAFCDRENNLWFPTENGLSKLYNSELVTYVFPKREASGALFGAAYTSGDFLFHSLSALQRLSARTVTEIRGWNENFDKYFNGFFSTDDGKVVVSAALRNVIVSRSSPLVCFEIKNDRYVPDVPLTALLKQCGVLKTYSVYTEANGAVWFAADNGLYRLVGGNLQKINVRDEHDVDANIEAIAADGKGNMWFACKDRVLVYASAAKSSGVELKIKYSLYAGRELPEQNFDKIFADSRGRIWCGGSEGGLVMFRPEESGKAPHVSVIRFPDISSIEVTAIAESTPDNIWIGTNRGLDLFYLRGDSITRIEKNAYEKQLSGAKISFLKKHLGRMMIGSTGGMSVIELETAKFSQPAPLVYISDARVGNATHTALMEKGDYRLPPDSNSISFFFNSPSFSEQPVRFSYMLKGIDQQWSAPAEEGNVTYGQLKPGEYTFLVKAINSNGTESPASAKKHFIILAPFYRTGWFYLLCALAVAGIFYSIYRYRRNRSRDLERVRAGISKDLHDDIGSTLSSITMMSNLIRSKAAGSSKESADLAANIEESSRQMIYSMSDIVWSIKPGNDTHEQMISRLREYMNIMFESGDTDYALISEGNTARRINMYLRRDVYLMCKEIINNTSKYAGAQNFRLTISTTPKMLSIVSEDDGAGFDETHVQTGNGLYNIIQRAHANRGKAIYKTAPGAGMKWEISIPVKKV